MTVVLNWNGAAMTLECLQHLSAQTFQADVIVIDNGSTDNSTHELARAASANCQVLPLSRNLGFAEGMNVGIRLAMERGADFVWLLNNDAFAEPDCLRVLVDFLERMPDVGMATPRLLEPNGEEQHAGGRLRWDVGLGLERTAGLLNRATIDTWLTGTALLVRIRSLREVGLFDPRFFAYFEDIDLSLRMVRSGIDLRAVPGAVVHHLGSSSTGGPKSPLPRFLMIRNEWLLQSKHRERGTLPAAFSFAARNLRKAGFLHLDGHLDAAVLTVQALTDAFRGRYGPPMFNKRAGPLVRTLAGHPWRLAGLLDATAAVLSRIVRWSGRGSAP